MSKKNHGTTKRRYEKQLGIIKRRDPKYKKCTQCKQWYRDAYPERYHCPVKQDCLSTMHYTPSRAENAR